MYGTFYLARVGPTDTTFLPEYAREDIQVLSFTLSQREGDFAIFQMAIRNPMSGLLAPSAQKYVWVSWIGQSGLTPLFFGRIVGVPSDINRMKTTVTIRARPDDYVALKEVLADSLKVQPYWDDVWINPDSREDADVVLQARTQRFHVDRVTHALTVSDIVTGEDGTLTFGPTQNVIADSVSLSYSTAVKSSVKVRAEVGWTQRALGTLDVSKAITDAFAIAGTTHPGMISSYTWEHLADSWPLPNDNIGGGWSWFDSNIELGNNRWVSQEDLINDTLTSWANSYFGSIGEEFGFGFPSLEEQRQVTLSLGVLKPNMIAQFAAERSRTEIVEFTATADLQPVLTEPGEDEPILISLSSNDVSEPVDVDESGNTEIPIGDIRQNAYMRTDRGVRSMEYLIARARAELIDQARCVQITFVVPFDYIDVVTLRKNVVLEDDRLPGGQASGKIVNYAATGDTESGTFRLAITIACTIGRGQAVVADAGDAVYIEDDYIDPEYFLRDNLVSLLGSGDLTYDDYRGYTVTDDGLTPSFFMPTVASMVNSVIVTNGPDTQMGAFPHEEEPEEEGGISFFSGFQDTKQAKTVLPQMNTEVCIDFKPVVGGPFETNVPVVTNQLQILAGIDLEAA